MFPKTKKNLSRFTIFFRHFAPSKVGVSLARKGLQRLRVRVKRGVCGRAKEKDGDSNMSIDIIFDYLKKLLSWKK